MRTLEERFWSKVDTSGGPDACWPWTAGRNRGYGRFYHDGRMVQASNVALWLTIGPSPDPTKTDALHSLRCVSPACTNPRHLRWGDDVENALDAIEAGTRVHKTHCVHGHVFDEANTYYFPLRGKRQWPRRACRECWRERDRRKAAAKRAEREGEAKRSRRPAA